ncbi:SCP-like protein [Oesophagostomum dentatum]|uniref:SCP-like protein n=1 Tax=Oesophagostomum dentatum TaxID=61180 RepID=A0A0B1TNN2_OESDE|nr:SCP-like protein [Oesophagostomum dentatum]
MCRKASKMPTLTYDCKLETSAIARASQCSQMNSTPSQNISENSHIFTANLNRTLSQAAQAATQLWWSELAALESGIDQIQNIFYTHLGINSFAKIASDLTTKIGCAVIHCTDSINVVCHYQTTLANAKKLYTAGPTCKKCENGTVSCVNGLCPASFK